MLKTWLDASLDHGSDRSEIVGRISALHVLKSERLKILASIGAQTIVDHLAIRDDHQLVKEVEDTIASLVKTDDIDLARLVALFAADTSKFESRAGVETSCGVVPAIYGCVYREHLGE